mgnify:FL=1|tara:strand:- start:45 stop:572 length:528 start_codon:yes stop_codon:yes gene_type:complete
MNVFKTLSAVDVNSKTEKKGKFTYLSWSFAWAELKKVSPTATSKVYHDENTNMPYFASKAGVIVKVGITIDGLEHISYLPIMDFRNASIPSDIINMMDVNKAIQRCTVKAIALHGLGLYIYAGEDLPEEQKPIISESQYDATLLSKNKKHVDYFLNNFEMTDEQKIKFQEIKDAE